MKPYIQQAQAYEILSKRKPNELYVLLTTQPEVWTALPPQGLANGFILCNCDDGVGLLHDQVVLANKMGIQVHMLIDERVPTLHTITDLLNRNLVKAVTINVIGEPERKDCTFMPDPNIFKYQPQMLIKGYAGSGTTNMSLHKMMEQFVKFPNDIHVHVNDEYAGQYMFKSLARLNYMGTVRDHSRSTGALTFIDYGHGEKRWDDLREYLEKLPKDSKVHVYLDAPSISHMNNNKIQIVYRGDNPESHIRPWHRDPDQQFYELIQNHRFECATVRHRVRPGELKGHVEKL